VLEAIANYAGAYEQFERMQHALPDWLPQGDQKTGVVGEFYAKVYLHSQYPDAEIAFGSHSQHAWDLEVETPSERFRVQVKAVSAYSTTRRISPIHHGWDELYLLDLDKSLFPVGFWAITDTGIVPPGETLTGRKMPRRGKPGSGSSVFAAREDRLPELLEALRGLGRTVGQQRQP
jgi:hypothetical protein